MRTAIKAAPTELIGTHTSYYKQFAPTELEEQLIRLHTLVRKIMFPFINNMLGRL